MRHFFAVDFDADKLVVHKLGDLRVFKRLVLHDVAPVTSRVTYRKEDRLVLLLGCCKSSLTPRPPINRVRRVLKQIRALLKDESIVLRPTVFRQLGNFLSRRQRLAFPRFFCMQSSHDRETKEEANAKDGMT